MGQLGERKYSVFLRYKFNFLLRILDEKEGLPLLKGLTKAEEVWTHPGRLHAFVAIDNHHVNK